jgi:hypothetical protein
LPSNLPNLPKSTTYFEGVIFERFIGEPGLHLCLLGDQAKGLKTGYLPLRKSASHSFYLFRVFWALMEITILGRKFADLT